MKFCPRCLRKFSDEEEACPGHGALVHILLPPKRRYLLVGLFGLLAIGAGAYVTGGYPLDLISTVRPGPVHTKFLAIWFFIGVVCVLALGAWFTPWLCSTGRAASLRRLWEKGSDGRWVAIGSVLAVAIPALIRFFILEQMPIVDDETAYEYSARLLAAGQLTEATPPFELFFDRHFLFNDARRFTQYFLGWPALMLPGIWLGFEGYINCLYAGLTLPAVFLVARRMFGSNHARLAALLYITSPLFMIGAATQMAHTSCLLALAWMFWFYLNCRDGHSPALHYFAVAATFGVAFFIRPSSALGVGLPVLIALGYDWLTRRKSPGQKLRAAVAFAVPAAVLATLFFLINDHLTGSPFTTAYQIVFDYAEANGFRFSPWSPADAGAHLTNANHPIWWFAYAILALVRMNFALLGWPLSVVFALYGNFRRHKLLWAMVASYLVLHLPVSSLGVETFGPVHYFEMGLPLIFLVCAAALHLSQRLTREHGADDLLHRTLAHWPYVLVGVMVLLNLAVYSPVKLHALTRISNIVERPYRAVEDAPLTKPAVVFVGATEYGNHFVANARFAPICPQDAPTHHFVYWRPVNPPGFDAEVLWANHISLRADKKLLGELFPDRQGYLLLRNRQCEVRLMPLEEIDEERELAPAIPEEQLEPKYKPS